MEQELEFFQHLMPGYMEKQGIQPVEAWIRGPTSSERTAAREKVEASHRMRRLKGRDPGEAPGVKSRWTGWTGAVRRQFVFWH